MTNLVAAFGQKGIFCSEETVNLFAGTSSFFKLRKSEKKEKQKKKKVEEKETERREVRDRVAGNFHLADVTLQWWRVTSDWLKLHCHGGGYLLDAWGVNEQGFVGPARDQIL